MDQFFKMCGSMLTDGGTIRLICTKDVFERWAVKKTAANNNFHLDHKYRLTDGYCPGFTPRKGCGVDPNEVLSTVDSVLCHFSKIAQVQTGQGQIGSEGAISDPPTATMSASPITFTSEETLSVTYEAKKLHSFNLNGMLKMHVDKHVDRNFQIQIERGDTPKLKFKPHKSIQKGRFRKENIVGIEVPDRPFPAGNTNLIRWSLHRKDESNVPIKINCRPSVCGNEMSVRIEYTASNMFVLQNVVITVHLPTLNEAPIVVELVHGDWRYDSEKSVLEWSMPLIDNSNPTGSMQFVVRQATDVSKFFSVKVEFTSTSTFSKLKIVRIIPDKKGAAPKFSYVSELVTGAYEIIN